MQRLKNSVTKVKKRGKDLGVEEHRPVVAAGCNNSWGERRETTEKGEWEFVFVKEKIQRRGYLLELKLG